MKRLNLTKPGTVQDAILRNRAKNEAEQLKIGTAVLGAAPEGVTGYNAFVNEPVGRCQHEPTLR